MRSFSVKSYLLFYLSVFLILLGVIFAASYEIGRRASQRQEHEFTVSFKLVMLLSQVNEELRHIDSAAKEFLLTTEVSLKTESENLIVGVREKLKSALGLRSAADPSLSLLLQHTEQFLERRVKLLEQASGGLLTAEEVHSLVFEELPSDRIFLEILELEKVNISKIELERETLLRRSREGQFFLLIGTIATAALFSFLLARYLVWPISALANAMARWRLGEQWDLVSPIQSSEFQYLYREMGVMTNRSNSHYFELLRSNKDLEEFASIASHDLRAPLQNVIGFSGILQLKLKGRLNEEEIKIIDSILFGANRMEILVKNLLSYARIGAASLNLSEISLSEVVDQVKRILVQDLKRYGVSVSIQDLPVIRGDKEQLLQLFQNLFENSIKFRQSPSPLVIAVSARRQQTDWVLSVTDNGIGIPKGDLHRVFEIFKRSANASGSRGAGLGLAIVKRIVERHGGVIWIESELGRGTTVSFTLGDTSNLLDTRTILSQAS